MPSLSHKALQSASASHFNASARSADAPSATVWTRSNTDDVSLAQLHKFWSGLSVVARRELLRIDKQTLFEQVRKNLYCSRCHGLLVEGFSQIILYGRSRQAGMVGHNTSGGSAGRQLPENGYNASVAGFSDDSRDPSVHPWGGLAATRDSMLTVLDCFLDEMPLEVFESARARERERELLYPDACGGGGRGWICHNGSFNGRGHGLKETCALHTARLSCEALVDFWSALGDETRRTLLRMKEEDFIERLMFRFNSKRFCRDCRRNVLREFKEMKELKRSRKEPQCTRWFCAADTVFRYEVSESAVQVNWQNCFAGDGGSAFQRFEWALGTGEGKSDILGYEDVGLSESAYVDNLDLANTTACFIIVRGWKLDGRYTELSAKAHALKGQLCVHRRLIVGDGYVSITEGESIQRFFERAEETEEEEDEDAIDKDGNDYEGEASRPQKHAKSPELARDFLLDAATVIFKEQVEKAFREGTARQNAHSIFVCLALSLLEERVHVACKEITSLEKQNKLLEEEEYEKREEEERRERRKQKEKEKKLRRKEKLKSKEKGNRKLTTPATLDSNGCLTASSLDHEEERESSSGSQVEGTESNNSEDSMSARPSSPDTVEARPSADGFDSENGVSNKHETFTHTQVIDDTLGLRDGNGAFIVERSKSARRRTQGRKGLMADNFSASGRRGLTPTVGAENGSLGISRRISSGHLTEERGASNCRGQQKNGFNKTEAEAISKRLDGWSSSQSYNITNRHELVQSCACGSSETSSRPKVGHRAPARLGVRDSNISSSRSSERVGTGNLAAKASYHVGHLDRALSRKSTEHSQGRSGTAGTFDRRDQRAASNMDRSLKPSYQKSSYVESSAGMTSGSHGGPTASPNGSTGHGCIDSVLTVPVPVAVKPMWTRAATSSSSSNGVAVRIVTNAGSCPVDSEHGKSDTVRNAQGRPLSPWTPVSKATSPEAACMTTAEISETSREDLRVSELPPSSKKGEPCKVPELNASVSVRAMVTPDGHGRTIVAGIAARPVSSSTVAASDSTSATLPMQSVSAVVNVQGCGIPQEASNAEFVAGASGGQEPPPAMKPLLPQAAAGMGAVADATSEVHHTSPTIGTLPISSSHLHGSGHQSINFPAGNLSRPPSKGMFAFTDVLPLQGPMHHTLQPPRMTPGSMNVHHQRPFGFFPGGPWPTRGRSGMLPLPQPGGFTVSGPGGLSIGVLPPISLSSPGTSSVGFGIGHLPAIPNGLNPLQLREHQQVFLSRFGGPGRGGHNRGPAEITPGLTPDSCGLEGAVAADVGPLSENQDALGQVLSSGTSSVPSAKEKGHNDPSTADFSLFHSGWPVSGGTKETDASLHISKTDKSSLDDVPTSASEKSPCIGGLNGVAKSSSRAGEYSLFASAPSKGFAFF